MTYSCSFAIPSSVFILRNALKANVPAKRVYAARNFAKTIPIRLTGLVRRSLSVPDFFSSLNSFIVRRGISTIKNKSIIEKYAVESVVERPMVLDVKHTPLIAKNTAENTYPIGEVK
jgi:hypothetical protein